MVYSILTTSTILIKARLVELVDTRDLKSLDPRSCRFESGSGHQPASSFLFVDLALILQDGLCYALKKIY